VGLASGFGLHADFEKIFIEGEKAQIGVGLTFYGNHSRRRRCRVDDETAGPARGAPSSRSAVLTGRRRVSCAEGKGPAPRRPRAA
jgi:hypothetical protein